MSGVINRQWVRMVAGNPVYPATKEITLNGSYVAASAGPLQGGICLRTKVGACQVIVRDHAGNQMGDTMAVTTTPKLLTSEGATSPFWLMGQYSLEVSGLDESAETLIAEEVA